LRSYAGLSLNGPNGSDADDRSGVVIVDPDPDNRELYQTFLELFGWDVSPFETASAALARLCVPPGHSPSIFEVVLPDMTALAFCEAIDAVVGDGPPLRRIVVTSQMLSADDCAALSRQGVAAIYEKPCGMTALLRALRR
jgi:DNA-binding NtrC family response regulator